MSETTEISDFLITGISYIIKKEKKQFPHKLALLNNKIFIKA